MKKNSFFNFEKRRALLVAMAMACVLTLSFAVKFYGIENIILWTGIGNRYLFVFLAAVLGGASVFTTGGFYVVLVALAMEGYLPVLLGIFSGLGIALGDLIFYFIGNFFGRTKAVKGSALYRIIFNFIERQSKLHIRIFVFLYTAFVPIPNDILMIVLGVSKYRLREFILYVILGDVVLMTLIAWFAAGF